MGNGKHLSIETWVGPTSACLREAAPAKAGHRKGGRKPTFVLTDRFRHLLSVVTVYLEMGYRDLFGVWNLDIGISNRGAIRLVKRLRSVS